MYDIALTWLQCALTLCKAKKPGDKNNSMNPSITDQLFLAIRNGDASGLSTLLLVNPELVGARDPRGFTPLVLATYLNNLPAAKVLVDAGADLNATDGMGNTALMGSCFKGNTEVIRYLIEAGADVNIVAGNGGTALHFAAMVNNPEVAALLVGAGASLDVKDGKGLTAADHARQQGATALAAQLAPE